MVFQALSILTTYLTSSPISPLQQHFVELAQPLATDVDANIMLNSEAAVTVDFENVPIDKMLEIDARFKNFIKKIVEKGSDALDLERIHTISKFQFQFQFQSNYYSKVIKLHQRNIFSHLVCR